MSLPESKLSNIDEERDVQDLVGIFNACFEESCQTILCPGGEEPIYLPSDADHQFARIISTKDYFSSALHEISHWCIAGEARRKLVDFGYWYEPDGRTAIQQREFERVEVKPQALEWLFTLACGMKFRVSADNLDNPDIAPSNTFKKAVAEQAGRYLSKDLKGRPKVFYEALVEHYSSCPDGTEFLVFDWRTI